MSKQSMLKNCDCLQDCEDIRFDYTVQELPIDLEKECKQTTFTPYITSKIYDDYPGFLYNYNSLKSKVTFGQRLATPSLNPETTEEICNQVLLNDVAIVSVQMATDRYTRNTKSLKATFGDKIGNLGNDLVVKPVVVWLIFLMP